jgi:hypothetical protein
MTTTVTLTDAEYDYIRGNAAADVDCFAEPSDEGEQSIHDVAAAIVAKLDAAKAA